MIINAKKTYTRIIRDIIRKAQEGTPVQKLTLEGDIALASFKASTFLLIQLLSQSSKIKSLSSSRYVFIFENMIAGEKKNNVNFFILVGHSFANDKDSWW
jgi:hypothetical protein